MLGENLKRVRESRGVTQEELAEQVHVVRQTVSKWEKGLSVPDSDILMAIAETLNVSMSDLMGADAVQAKNIEELSVQTAVLNEQIFLQNRRIAKMATFAKRAIAVCLLAVVVAVGVGAIVWFATPGSYSQITVEYEMGGDIREAHINVNTRGGSASMGYDWPPEDNAIFRDIGGEGMFLDGAAEQSDSVQLLLHAMEVAIENGGGEVKRISSATYD